MFGPFEIGLVVIIIIVAIPLYLIPTIIALARHHQNVLPVFLLNLLTGWTFIGWVVALVWSTTKSPPQGSNPPAHV